MASSQLKERDADAEARSESDSQIGKRATRKEDDRLITGQGQFLDDIEPTGNIHHLAILRSPHGHAKIESIDYDDALALDPVKAVLTGEDVAEMSDPFPVTAQNPPGDYYSMAIDRVRYDGEPVAAVVAESKYAAKDALEHIYVDYDTQPVVMDPEEATADDAVQIHDAGNVANHRELSYGNVDDVFEDADNVVSERFEVPPTACPPLETYGVIADYSQSQSNVDIWANFQGPVTMHTITANVLSLPTSDVQVHVPEDQGGGFGTKISIYPYMVLVALASQKAEVPVKWVESRREHLRASSMHAARVQYMEGAVDDDGSIRGLRIRQYNDYGAYMRPPEPGTAYLTIGHWQGPYDIEALASEQYAVQTNKCPTGPHRGYGQHLHSFALEGLVDRMAEEIEMNPTELRRHNFVGSDEFPYETLTGGVYDSGDYQQAFDLALNEVGYEDWLVDRGDQGDTLVGVGISTVLDSHASNMGYLDVALPPEQRRNKKSGAIENVILTMGPDTSVKATLTSAPQGQGHETTASQIIADVLKIDPGDIRVSAGFDTESQPLAVSSGTYSDRFGTIGHTAIARAAKDIRSQLERIGAHLLDEPVHAVRLEEGEVVADDSGSVSLKRIAGTTYWNPQELPEGVDPSLASFTVVSMEQAGVVTDDDRMNSTMTNGFGSHVVVVEIDKATGDVEILDYVAVHDSGTIVNPMIVEGQIEGATAYGLALVLYEFHEYDETGTLQTDTLMDYGMPTAKEIPPIRQAHIETPSPFTELGSKGVGDAGTIAAVPAVANAIRDALTAAGADVSDLPLSSDRIWQRLRTVE
jgi:2-furoyl-CoA dehydrogenase large subunit